MPKQYVLKRPVMDANRIKKLAKEIINDGQVDRAKAFEAYEYFKNLDLSNPNYYFWCFVFILVFSLFSFLFNYNL